MLILNKDVLFHWPKHNWIELAPRLIRQIYFYNLINCWNLCHGNFYPNYSFLNEKLKINLISLNLRNKLKRRSNRDGTGAYLIKLITAVIYKF